MSNLKKALFVVIFVVAVLIVPSIILLLTVDASTGFGVYVIVFGIILFSIFGYIVASLRSLSKEVKDAVEEMKMQNAAIAYKLTNSPAPSAQVEKNNVEEVKDTSNVNLNPAEPLTINGKVVSSESIGDFK